MPRREQQLFLFFNIAMHTPFIEEINEKKKKLFMCVEGSKRWHTHIIF